MYYQLQDVETGKTKEVTHNWIMSCAEQWEHCHTHTYKQKLLNLTNEVAVLILDCIFIQINAIYMPGQRCYQNIKCWWHSVDVTECT